MRKIFLSCGILAAAAALAPAASIVAGTPGNSSLATPTKPTAVGTLVTFDSLAQSSSPVASVTTGGLTVSSIDGIEVIPFSTMSYPNEIYDAGSGGTANLRVTLGTATNALGIGVADADGVSITLQALAANGSALGSAFTENLNSTADVNGNSYFIISDTSFDIYGVSILQSTANANYSGLAIDDVQAAATPEPSAFALLAAGLTLAGGLIRGKKANSEITEVSK